jgi:hypothetical protein
MQGFFEDVLFGPEENNRRERDLTKTVSEVSFPVTKQTQGWSLWELWTKESPQTSTQDTRKPHNIFQG